jgi:hypothetical protein
MADVQVAEGSNVAHKQQSMAPTRKVMAGGAIGAAITILVWVLNAFKLLPQGQQIPAEVAAALTTLVSFAVSYFVPPAPADQVVPATG